MPPGYELAPIFAIATLFPLLLISTMHHPGHFFSRFLELAPLRFIGRLSYSLYIWQQLFFRRNYEFPRYGIHYLQLPWVNLLCLVPCALLSYYFIEQPLIRAGQKIVRSRVPVAVLAV
jgi:peptidoglycan/LPS O-acetylase OafA/YrhL